MDERFQPCYMTVASTFSTMASIVERDQVIGDLLCFNGRLFLQSPGLVSPLVCNLSGNQGL